MQRLTFLGCAAVAILALTSIGCGDPKPADGGVDGGCPTCSEPSICEQAGCVAHQRCETVAGEVVCVDATCEPGYAWSGSGCEPIAGATCESGVEGSIAPACMDLGRGCRSTDSGAECGECLAGGTQVDSACVVGDACAAIGCALSFRQCLVTDGALSCGACLDGFSNVGGGCTATDCSACDVVHRTCDLSTGSPVCGSCLPEFPPNLSGECEAAVYCSALTCDQEYRTCSQEPHAGCDDACIDGYVWEAASGTCRPRVTCEQLACPGDQLCLTTSATADSECVLGCPAGSAWYPDGSAAGACAECGSGIVSTSVCQSDVGGTGRLLHETGVAGGSCFCEPQQGYFIVNDRATGICDQDDDGWINDQAQAEMESPVAFRAQAAARACTLRRVDRFVLHPELFASTQALLGSALPLYETARNDGQGTDDRPPYGLARSVVHGTPTAALQPNQLNSLTRACVSLAAEADFNDNGLRDMVEGQTDTVPPKGRPKLSEYYQQYAKQSYYIELHDGWFEPNADPTQPGSYHIAERPRLGLGNGRIPFSFRPDPGLPAEESYWRECAVHDDPIYGRAGVTTRANGDFAAASAMQHHSLFKCVTAETKDTYLAGGYVADEDPSRAYLLTGGPLGGYRLAWSERVGGGEPQEQVLGVANPCSLSGPDYAAASAPTPRAALPVLDCPMATVGALAFDGNGAGFYGTWVLVEYTNQGPAEDEAPNPAYDRGCINECDELTIAHCPTYDINQASEGLICDQAAASHFGQIECGCDTDYSGLQTSCGLACPGAHLQSAGLAPYSRANGGLWMCLDRVVTDSTLSGSTNYPVFRGFVPALPTDGKALTGSTLTLRSRLRREVHSVSP